MHRCRAWRAAHRRLVSVLSDVVTWIQALVSDLSTAQFLVVVALALVGALTLFRKLARTAIVLVIVVGLGVWFVGTRAGELTF